MAQRSLKLPLEIYDIIIDFLAEDEDSNTTLGAVALTCKTLRPKCQSHIFSELHLVPSFRLRRTADGACDSVADAFTRRLDNLTAVFKSNPSLASHVREVHYMIRRADIKEHDFHSVLQTLSRVKVLTLMGTVHGAGSIQATTDWPSLSPTLHAALKNITNSSTFRSLSLDHIVNFPIDLLTASGTLTQLTVDSADFQGSGSVASSGRVQLTSLTLMDYSSRSIRSIMEVPNIDFSQLRTLNSFDKTASLVVAKLLDQSKCLKSLTCTVWDSFAKPFKDILKPHTLNTLTSFSAVILVPPWLGVVNIDPYYSLSDEFDKWAGRNIIEKVKLKIDVSEGVNLPTTCEAWAGLNTLAIRDRFPKMTRVSLKINLLSNGVFAQEFKATLEEQQSELFKALLDSDDIMFQFSIETFQTYP